MDEFPLVKIENDRTPAGRSVPNHGMAILYVRDVEVARARITCPGDWEAAGALFREEIRRAREKLPALPGEVPPEAK